MNLLFDFTVDKETATIYITREFAADIDLVWDAWTKQEILEQWMAPKPYRIKTKVMDFREGGRWLYAMVSPENVAAGWTLAEYIRIQPKTIFTSRNSFTDENGNPITSGFTYSITENIFKAGEEKTTVRVVKKMSSLAELEKFIALGFKEGMAHVMNVLDEYFLNMVPSK